MDANSLEALASYLKEIGLTQGAIANRLGVSQPYVNALMTGRKNFGKSQAYRWRDAFGINPSWLLVGEGPMLLSGQPTATSVEDNPGASLPDIGRRTDVWVGKDDKVYWTEALQIGDEEEYQRAKEEGVRLIPQYVESVQGGNDGATDVLQTIDTYWAIPGIDGTAVIPVSGNSMAPNFPSGCHVITRPYPFNPSRPLSLPFGEVYAFALRQEDGFPPTHHIKRLIRHPEKAHERTHYIARSFNPDFADFEVSIDDICMLAAVVARIEVTRTFDF